MFYVDFTYWPLLGSLNKWNIIHFTNKKTSSEDFDEMHQLVLHGISDNIASQVYTGKYGAISAEDPTTLRYYVFKYLS